jgi:hypothetical protein
MFNKSFYKYFIALLLPITILSGCKKYLDQKPITELGTDMVFSDVPSATKAVVSVYSRLVGDQGYGIRLSLYYTVDNDEMQGPKDAMDIERRAISRYAANSSNTQLSSPFNQLFTGIEFANNCIDNIPLMAKYTSGTDNEKKQLRRLYGESLTLRAQFYLEAIRNWGDLPAHFTSAANLANTNPFPKATDRDSLYEVLLSNLKTAADLVPWRNEVAGIGDPVDERITKGTVKALRARIALFRAGFSLRKNGQMMQGSNPGVYYKIALDECKDIIASGQHSLNPSFKALWKDQVGARVSADPNGELMFQASGSGRTGTGDTKLGYYNGPKVNGKGGTGLYVLPTYFYSFDSTDLRRDVTCTPYSVNADGIAKSGADITSINDGKYRRDWISNPAIAPTDAAQYFGLKWQIIRYSDVLLMFAEAENELNGPTSAAYDAINQVRRRGYGKPITTPDASVDLAPGLSKTDFFTALVKERSLELGGEGTRKYDLIRWNLLASKIAETKTTLTAMAARSGVWASLPQYMYFRTNNTADDKAAWFNSFYVAPPTAWATTAPTGTTKITWITSAIGTAGVASPLGRFASGFTTGKSELLPLPQAVLDANFNMKQNPGY